MNIIKILGLLTVFASCFLFGILSSLKLKKRADELKDVCCCTQKLKTDLIHSGRELAAVLDNSFKDCSFIRFNSTFVQISDSSLSDSDKELLQEFFSVLGTGTKAAEEEKILYYQGMFEHRYDLAKKEADSKCKIFTVTGICVGLAAVILFT